MYRSWADIREWRITLYYTIRSEVIWRFWSTLRWRTLAMVVARVGGECIHVMMDSPSPSNPDVSTPFHVHAGLEAHVEQGTRAILKCANARHSRLRGGLQRKERHECGLGRRTKWRMDDDRALHVYTLWWDSGVSSQDDDLIVVSAKITGLNRSPKPWNAFWRSEIRPPISVRKHN